MHFVGDLQKVNELYPGQFFDVALVSGLFGFGLDTVKDKTKR